MNAGVPPEVLTRLSARIASQMGLHFPPERWRQLEAGLLAAARKLGFEPTEAGWERLWAGGLSQRDIEILGGELTVGETYFFRDACTFDFLRERVFPEVLARSQAHERRLRIWSAGCCTGEEPYSVALLLDYYFPELSSWPVTILGTDINPLFLQRASDAVFGEWSFRCAPSWLKPRYFKPLDGHRYQLVPCIRDRVTFSYLNLADGTFPSLINGTNACDLILCRNVLMYFTPERARAVIAGFHLALIESGWLIVSPAEYSGHLAERFTPVDHAGALFFRKPGRETHTLAAREGPDAPIGGESHLKAAHAASPSSEIAGPPGGEDARTRFGRGDYAGAVKQLEDEAASRPLSTLELALLARACANLGDLAMARTWVDRALAADKLDADMHYLRALIVQELGDFAEAAISFRQTLYLDPLSVLAQFGLAHNALRRGQRAEAIRLFSHALRLLERHPPDEVLPHADGLSAGRLKAAIEAALTEERAA